MCPCRGCSQGRAGPLTFGGWRAAGSRCRRGTSSSSARSALSPPLDLATQRSPASGSRCASAEGRPHLPSASCRESRPQTPGQGALVQLQGCPSPGGGNSARGPPHPHRRLLPQKCHGQRLETVLKDKRDDVGSAKTLCFLQDYF